MQKFYIKHVFPAIYLKYALLDFTLNAYYLLLINASNMIISITYKNEMFSPFHTSHRTEMSCMQPRDNA